MLSPASATCVAALGLAVACTGASDLSTPSGPSEALVAVDGTPVAVLPQLGEHAMVWIFVTTDCPIANGYAPEIQAIIGDYDERGVRFLLVHVDATASDGALRQHALDYGYRCAVVADREHELVRRAAATITPEVAVYDRSGNLRYRGRIDDRFPDLGQRRTQATTSELRDALDALLAGRAVRVPFSDAIGCVIESPGT